MRRHHAAAVGRLLRLHARTDRGASAVEYALLLAGLAALIVLAIFTFHDTITGLFDDSCSDISDAQGGSSQGC